MRREDDVNTLTEKGDTPEAPKISLPFLVSQQPSSCKTMSKSPSLRRIQADIRELSLDPSPNFHAAPLENDMFEWHFTIRGAKGTDFEGGVYHGRILLPPEYPFKPPHIVFLTPTGRFETNTKVCLSFSAYHPELWQPAWGVRLILEALISFLPTPADGAIGAIDWTPKERKKLAIQSQKWSCPHCGPILRLLPEVRREEDKKPSSTFSKEIAELHRLQQQAERQRQAAADVETEANPPTPDTDTEEEIVLDDTEDAVDDDDEDDDDDGQGRWEDIRDATADHETAPPDLAPPIVSAAQEPSANMPTDEPPALAWADPLVDLLIVSLLAICCLFYRKYVQLDLELRELQAYEYTQSVVTTALAPDLQDITMHHGDEL